MGREQHERPPTRDATGVPDHFGGRLVEPTTGVIHVGQIRGNDQYGLSIELKGRVNDRLVYLQVYIIFDRGVVQEADSAPEEGERILRGQSGRTQDRGLDLLEQVLVALFAGGHVLLIGVPGLAKTLLVSTLAKALSVEFKRVQFTPDMMPGDITGTEVLQEDKSTGEKSFVFVRGPLFTNLLLADEINRTPPKTQAALLEAMQERQVSVGKQTYKLEEPFMVMATQNPIEHHGTYPLPESQLDRFLMRIEMGYPSHGDEKQILRANISYDTADQLTPVMSAAELLEAQRLVDKVEMDDLLLEYLMALVTATRNSEDLALGVSPRGAMSLYRAAQSRAFLQGRYYCIPDDVKQLAIAFRTRTQRAVLSNGFGEDHGILGAAVLASWYV